jgi:hypothetical protein
MHKKWASISFSYTHGADVTKVRIQNTAFRHGYATGGLFKLGVYTVTFHVKLGMLEHLLHILTSQLHQNKNKQKEELFQLES